MPWVSWHMAGPGARGQGQGSPLSDSSCTSQESCLRLLGDIPCRAWGPRFPPCVRAPGPGSCSSHLSPNLRGRQTAAGAWPPALPGATANHGAFPRIGPGSAPGILMASSLVSIGDCPTWPPLHDTPIKHLRYFRTTILFSNDAEAK